MLSIILNLFPKIKSTAFVYST